MITAVIVDDHPIVRAGMRTVLGVAADIAVVAKGTNSADALHLVAKHQPTPPLIPRELEVLCLLAQGLGNATIAQRLVVTKRTVQSHVSNIYGKLKAASYTEVALYAIRHGLVRITEAGDTGYEP